MVRQISELEKALVDLIGEHRKLLAVVMQQQAAVKVMDANLIERASLAMEEIRRRIGQMDSRRRTLVQQIALSTRSNGELTLSRLAEMFPAQSPMLLKRRDELRSAIDAVSRANHVSGRVTQSLLGHLNTVLRLVAGAVERAGLYTRTGQPRVSNRIGMVEAVG